MMDTNIKIEGEEKKFFLVVLSKPGWDIALQ